MADVNAAKAERNTNMTYDDSKSKGTVIMGNQRSEVPKAYIDGMCSTSKVLATCSPLVYG